jgi:hypothetical protein
MLVFFYFFFSFNLDLLLQLGVFMIIFRRLLALSLLAETMVPLKLRTTPQIKTKTRRENNIRTSGDPGDYIVESITTKGRHMMKPGRRRAPRRPHHVVAWLGGISTHFRLVIFHI